MAEQLKSAFRTVLNLPDDVDFATVVYGQTAGWDSVAHMSLIAEIEERLSIMLPTEDVIDMSSYGKAVEIVSRHGVTP